MVCEIEKASVELCEKAFAANVSRSKKIYDLPLCWETCTMIRATPAATELIEYV